MHDNNNDKWPIIALLCDIVDRFTVSIKDKSDAEVTMGLKHKIYTYMIKMLETT